MALAVALHRATFAVSVVNLTHVHNYAKSLPRRSKTDALDAHRLLQFALERQPPTWTPPPGVYHEVRARFAMGQRASQQSVGADRLQRW